MYQPTPCVAAIHRELKAIGVEIDHPFNIGNRYDRLPKEVVDVLLRCLPLAGSAGEAEDIVRNLQRPAKPFDGRPLIETFERFDNENARCQMGLTFFLAKPTGTSDWLIQAVQDRRFGLGRDSLLPALANALPAEEALKIIEPLAEELPHGAVQAWAICGGRRELERLEAELEKYAHIKRLRFEDPWPSPFDRDEMRKAVGRIRTRLRKQERTPSPNSPTVSHPQDTSDNALAPALGGAREADA